MNSPGEAEKGMNGTRHSMALHRGNPPTVPMRDHPPWSGNRNTYDPWEW